MAFLSQLNLGSKQGRRKRGGGGADRGPKTPSLFSQEEQCTLTLQANFTKILCHFSTLAHMVIKIFW